MNTKTANYSLLPNSPESKKRRMLNFLGRSVQLGGSGALVGKNIGLVNQAIKAYQMGGNPTSIAGAARLGLAGLGTLAGAAGVADALSGETYALKQLKDSIADRFDMSDYHSSGVSDDPTFRGISTDPDYLGGLKGPEPAAAEPAAAEPAAAEPAAAEPAAPSVSPEEVNDILEYLKQNPGKAALGAGAIGGLGYGGYKLVDHLRDKKKPKTMSKKAEDEPTNFAELLNYIGENPGKSAIGAGLTSTLLYNALGGREGIQEKLEAMRKNPGATAAGLGSLGVLSAATYDAMNKTSSISDYMPYLQKRQIMVNGENILPFYKRYSIGLGEPGVESQTADLLELLKAESIKDKILAMGGEDLSPKYDKAVRFLEDNKGTFIDKVKALQRANEKTSSLGRVGQFGVSGLGKYQGLKMLAQGGSPGRSLLGAGLAGLGLAGMVDSVSGDTYFLENILSRGTKGTNPGMKGPVSLAEDLYVGNDKNEDGKSDIEVKSQQEDNIPAKVDRGADAILDNLPLILASGAGTGLIYGGYKLVDYLRDKKKEQEKKANYTVGEDIRRKGYLDEMAHALPRGAGGGGAISGLMFGLLPEYLNSGSVLRGLVKSVKPAVVGAAVGGPIASLLSIKNTYNHNKRLDALEDLGVIKRAAHGGSPEHKYTKEYDHHSLLQGKQKTELPDFLQKEIIDSRSKSAQENSSNRPLAAGALSAIPAGAYIGSKYNPNTKAPLDAVIQAYKANQSGLSDAFSEAHNLGEKLKHTKLQLGLLDSNGPMMQKLVSQKDKYTGDLDRIRSTIKSLQQQEDVLDASAQAANKLHSGKSVMDILKRNKGTALGLGLGALAAGGLYYGLRSRPETKTASFIQGLYS